MKGIIYCYTSPSGKKYVGQTRSETKRKSRFKNLNRSYGGEKIDNARKKYGPENFKYEILEKQVFDNKDVCLKWMDDREKYWIKYYNTYKKGYNSSEGGYSMKSKESIEKQRATMKKKYGGKMPEALKRNFKENHKRLIERCKKPIEQYDLDYNFINEFSSITEAAISCGINRQAIGNCANGKSNVSGGFIWKFKGRPFPKCNKNKASKRIAKYDKSWNLIKIYNTSKDAINDIPVKVSAAYFSECISHNKIYQDNLWLCKGFYYKYAE